MRSLIAIAALVLLASCADSPTKPTTSGGSSASTGGVARKPPAEPYECNDDLILPAHQPEECRKPESSEPRVACTFPSANNPPPVRTPDPIVGTYLGYTTEINRTLILRIYPDGSAGSGQSRNKLRWKKEGNFYPFYYVSEEGQIRDYPNYLLKYQDIPGEPNIVSFGSKQSWRLFEGIKKSSNPDYLFDHYSLSTVPNTGRRAWRCVNVGRKEKVTGSLWEREDLRNYADSLSECEALCLTSVQSWSPDSTCPQDRR